MHTILRKSTINQSLYMVRKRNNAVMRNRVLQNTQYSDFDTTYNVRKLSHTDREADKPFLTKVTSVRYITLTLNV